MIDPIFTENPIPNKNQFHWQIFGILMLLSILASLAAIPYERTIVSQFEEPTKFSQSPVHIQMIGNAISAIVLSSLTLGFGLWATRRTGIGAPLLTKILSQKSFSDLNIRRTFFISALLGILVALVIFGLAAIHFYFLPDDLPDSSFPTPIASLLGAISAGINEEIWLRFGVMSLAIAFLQMVTSKTRPTPAIVWTGNISAAFLFGLIHVPQALKLGSSTPAEIVLVLILNGLAGVTFGWVFWKHGLIMAMVAHFFTDVVLHVIPSFFV